MTLFQCLLQCRRKHGDDPIKFLDELLEALTVTKNSLAVAEIMKLFNQWYVHQSVIALDKDPSYKGLS